MNNAQAKVYQFPIQYVGLTFEQRQILEEEQAMRELREKARLEANKPMPWYKQINPMYGLFVDAEDYIPPIKRSIGVEAIKLAVFTVIMAGVILGLLAFGSWMADMVVSIKI